MEKLKISMLSDGPFLCTGFSDQEKKLANYLANKGHEIHYFDHTRTGQTLMPGTTLEDGTQFNFKIYGNGVKPYFQDILSNRLREIKVDFLHILLDSFMLMDSGFLNQDLSPTKAQSLWVPSDGGAGLPYNPNRDCSMILRKITNPVAMSKFAQMQIKEYYNIDCEYIPHGCFFEDTKVLTNKGWKKIKKIVKDKKDKILIGYKYNQFFPVNILGYHKIKLKDNMLLLITDKGRTLELTKDNPILTGKHSYKPSGNFKLNDKIYIPKGIDINNESSIFSRNNRWRRNNKSNKSNYKKRIFTSPINLCNQYKSRINKLFKIEWLENIQTWKKQSIKKRMLQGKNRRKQKNIFYYNPNNSLSHNKKEAIRTIKRIFGIKNTKKLAWEIYNKRERNSSFNKEVEYERIISIIEFEPKYKYVYDLKTNSKNFIANGIIVHNCDISLFKKYNEEKRNLLRMQWGLSDKFVILACLRNQPRKFGDRLFKAMSLIKNKIPNAIMLMHTDPYDPASYFDMMYYINKFNLQNRIRFTGMSWNKGFDYKKMPDIYNVADIKLDLTSGEGWGLTTTEAMACELPVVITDYTTSEEIVNKHKAGEVVKLSGTEYVDMYQSGQINYDLLKMNGTILGSWHVERGIADIKDASEKVIKLYKDENLRKEYGKNGHKAVESEYDFELVGKKWEDLIKKSVNG